MRLIATSGGYSPIVHLASHLGGRPVWRDDILGFVPGDAPQKRECVGGINGVYALGDVIADGFEGGVRAATEAGFKASVGTLPKTVARKEEATVHCSRCRTTKAPRGRSSSSTSRTT